MGGAYSVRESDEAFLRAYEILVGNLKGRDHLEDLGVDGRLILILKWALEI
jgi:hypothetical protein